MSRSGQLRATREVPPQWLPRTRRPTLVDDEGPAAVVEMARTLQADLSVPLTAAGKTLVGMVRCALSSCSSSYSSASSSSPSAAAVAPAPTPSAAPAPAPAPTPSAAPAPAPASAPASAPAPTPSAAPAPAPASAPAPAPAASCCLGSCCLGTHTNTLHAGSCKLQRAAACVRALQ